MSCASTRIESALVEQWKYNNHKDVGVGVGFSTGLVLQSRILVAVDGGRHVRIVQSGNA